MEVIPAIWRQNIFSRLNFKDRISNRREQVREMDIPVAFSLQ